MSAALHRTIKATEVYNKEVVTALRMQVHAWRAVALIGLVDRERGRGFAQFLFFHTVPFVNGPAVEKFIADTAELAKRSGIEAGVFSSAHADNATAEAE